MHDLSLLTTIVVRYWLKDLLAVPGAPFQRHAATAGRRETLRVRTETSERGAPVGPIPGATSACRGSSPTAGT